MRQAFFGFIAALLVLIGGPAFAVDTAEKKGPCPDPLPTKRQIASIGALAESGGAKAQFVLASYKLHGCGVEVSKAEAAALLRQSAEAGFVPAQYDLAVLLERGDGVPQDLAGAAALYLKAAEGGNVRAMHNYAVFAINGTAMPVDFALGQKWMIAAADRDDHEAQMKLGIMNQAGRQFGLEIDFVKAYFWYSLAARSGDEKTKEHAEKVGAALTEEQRFAADRAIVAWIPTKRDYAANAEFGLAPSAVLAE